MADGHLSVATIDDLIEEHARRPRSVNRSRQGEGRDVFHPTTSVARREVDVLDDPVVRIAWVDLALEQPADDLERSHRADGPAAIGGFSRTNLEAEDLGVRQRRDE